MCLGMVLDFEYQVVGIYEVYANHKYICFSHALPCVRESIKRPKSGLDPAVGQALDYLHNYCSDKPI